MIELLIAAALVAGGDSIEYRGDEGDLEVRAPRVESPSIRVDGRLDEAIWAEAAVLSGFTQFEPAEGRPATEPTEVRVLYSGDAIYFGIYARDSRPDEIRATLGERDRGVFSDDWVRILLDTFHDSRQGYLFYVNPLGIQADGLWIEGLESRRGGPDSPVDFNPDFIWESDARITEDGWVAEIRIPYVSL
ncbi:MAG: carbohydrate binding family 9 domain-containing protein, partial [Gemmatimonadetes bacterium]|nr:carbohydrate binding family 9 domain-containing protein [Gemmatimonadota bacterium]